VLRGIHEFVDSSWFESIGHEDAAQVVHWPAVFVAGKLPALPRDGAARPVSAVSDGQLHAGIVGIAYRIWNLSKVPQRKTQHRLAADEFGSNQAAYRPATFARDQRVETQ